MEADWTMDLSTGRTNSSPKFEELVVEVTRLIHNDAHMIISGNAGATARLIVAQLAHKHGLAPHKLEVES